ncbi:MAG: transglycosylase domain-containing protein, partial [Solirubrobacteraceae bacterium]
MMAVASDLPRLEDPLRGNSVILDSRGNEIGLLTGNQRQLFVSEAQIAPVMKHAIIAIEDRRFYTNQGYDLRGIGRALWQDVVNQRVVQGGSTITQQFVKNSLAAQDERTLFVKLREAALAYHLTRKWSKERILRNYLNSIYFGAGAYGIESAARTYFGRDHEGCETDKQRPCAAQLEPHEAALLAGMVASPSGFDPIVHRKAARERRDIVLQRMLEQNFISRLQYDAARVQALPTRADISPPREDTEYPYFTSWVKQQVVDKLGGGQTGARRAFSGGLTVRTTLDSKMQEAATEAISNWLPFASGPRASMVAIENRSGAVRAMVGGDDYTTSSFNLATQGRRQPGSSFKPFVLAEALRQDISPGSTWSSHKKVFKLEGGERFTVNNYNDAYAGVTTLANATTNSDNSVYAELGLKLGPDKVSRMARRLGVRTPVSRNAANSLGGLKQGVTPLDMAHAYETLAQSGRLTFGTMSPGEPENRRVTPIPGPVGVEAIGRGGGDDFKPVEFGGRKLQNRVRTRQVVEPAVADTVESILQTVVKSGTATRAFVPGVTVAGKTGTTEGYGDAWFVGWTKEYTIAVWVGYPDRFKPMETEFQGDPVAGGTYPAGIFKTFVEALVGLELVKKDSPDTMPVV